MVWSAEDWVKLGDATDGNCGILIYKASRDNINLSGISGKTLKPVSFHTGSRGVLHKIFEGIRFQQTHNRIACLQFDHVH